MEVIPRLQLAICWELRESGTTRLHSQRKLWLFAVKMCPVRTISRKGQEDLSELSAPLGGAVHRSSVFLESSEAIRQPPIFDEIGEDMVRAVRRRTGTRAKFLVG